MPTPDTLTDHERLVLAAVERLPGATIDDLVHDPELSQARVSYWTAQRCLQNLVGFGLVLPHDALVMRWDAHTPIGQPGVPSQRRLLAYVDDYTLRHGKAPRRGDVQRALRMAPTTLDRALRGLRWAKYLWGKGWHAAALLDPDDVEVTATATQVEDERLDAARRRRRHLVEDWLIEAVEAVVMEQPALTSKQVARAARLRHGEVRRALRILHELGRVFSSEWVICADHPPGPLEDPDQMRVYRQLRDGPVKHQVLRQQLDLSPWQRRKAVRELRAAGVLYGPGWVHVEDVARLEGVRDAS